MSSCWRLFLLLYVNVLRDGSVVLPLFRACCMPAIVCALVQKFYNWGSLQCCSAVWVLGAPKSVHDSIQSFLFQLYIGLNVL